MAPPQQRGSCFQLLDFQLHALGDSTEEVTPQRRAKYAPALVLAVSSVLSSHVLLTPPNSSWKVEGGI